MVNNLATRLLICLMLLALVALPLASGCARPPVVRVIKVGFLVDLSGPVAEPGKITADSLLDLFSYYNDEGLVPGVRFELVVYDTKYDPARSVPGYHWLRDQGVEFIVTNYAQDSDAIVPLAQADKIPCINSAPLSTDLIKGKAWGWGFHTRPPYLEFVSFGFEYVRQTWPHYPTKPKVAVISWDNALGMSINDGEWYINSAHPNASAVADQFDFVARIDVPTPKMDFSAYIPTIKDCDYIYSGCVSAPLAVLIKQMRAAGSQAVFLTSCFGTYDWKLVRDKVGDAGLVGTIYTATESWWTDECPGTNFVKEVMNRYQRAGTIPYLLSGETYESNFAGPWVLCQVIKYMVVDEGMDPKDVTGESVYQRLVKEAELNITDCGGHQTEMIWTETERHNHKLKLYVWKVVQPPPPRPVYDFALVEGWTGWLDCPKATWLYK